MAPRKRARGKSAIPRKQKAPPPKPDDDESIPSDFEDNDDEISRPRINGSGSANRRKRGPDHDEEINSDGLDEPDSLQADSDSQGEEDNDDKDDQDDQDNQDEQETVEEKRLRLAKDYLNKVGFDVKKQMKSKPRDRHRDEDHDVGGSNDDDNDDNELQDDDDDHDDDERRGISASKEYIRSITNKELEKTGRRSVEIASFLQNRSHVINPPKDMVNFDPSSTIVMHSNRGHRLSATCVAISANEDIAVTGSKDRMVILWDVATGKKFSTCGTDDPGQNPIKAKGHTKEVLAVAISSDGKYVASGGKDYLVRIWDVRVPQQSSQVHVFKGHRDLVNALAFRKNSLQLFSASDDRLVKVWNLEDMLYVETLFGHGAEVMSLNCLHKERLLSGGRDGSIRLWKIPEDSQLVFPTSCMAIDSVAMLSESVFLSGGDSGHLDLWSPFRKKPITTINNAHSGNWISAVAAAPYSDLLASGSSDGLVKLWKYSEKMQDPTSKHLQLMTTVPVKGFVNGLAFGDSKRILVMATGQEHRNGRWSRCTGAKNGLTTVRLPIPENFY